MSNILAVPQPLRILILGGTGFLGPQVRAGAGALGHPVQPRTHEYTPVPGGREARR